MVEPRQTSGTPADRASAPAWTWIIVSLVMVMFLVMSVAITVGALVVSRVDNNSDRITAASLAGCARTQLERERVNVLEATFYIAVKRNPAPDPLSSQLLKAIAWSPPVNCIAATTDPAHYVPPEPVPFSKLPSSYASKILEAASRKAPQPPPRPGP